MTVVALLCLASAAQASRLTVEITATVYNAADITDGKVTSPYQPVQIDYTSEGMIVAF